MRVASNLYSLTGGTLGPTVSQNNFVLVELSPIYKVKVRLTQRSMEKKEKKEHQTVMGVGFFVRSTNRVEHRQIVHNC